MLFSLLDKIDRYRFLKYREKQTQRHLLTYLFWECTLRCNLNCLHCGSDCLKTSNVPDMPAQDFIKSLKDIKNRWPSSYISVCITGGEPLIRQDLETVGKEIINLGYSWGIVTNAMLMTPNRFISLMNAGMTSISFSLDGFEKEHNYLRQNENSYRKVCNAIKLAVSIQKLNRNRLIFDVITCVHKGNINILRELREDLIEKGVEKWRIFSIFPEGRAAKNDLSLSKEEYVRLMEFIKETRKYRNKDGKSISVNYSCEGYLGKYELQVRDKRFFCRAGINVGSIMCDGNAGACLSVRNKSFIQGNIYEKTFPEIWENEYKNMRDRSWAACGKCAECKSFKYCLGNGLHLHKDDKSPPVRCNLEELT